MVGAVVAFVAAPLAGADAQAAAFSARTADTDRDARIDRVVVVLRSGASGRDVAVAGYRVTDVDRRGRRLLVRLWERSVPDTGARPRVNVRPGRGSRAATSRARDGAAPALISARLESDRGALTVWLSEPISFPGASDGPSVFAAPGLSIGRVAQARRSPAIRATVSEAHADSGEPAVALLRRGASRVRDAAGNRARAGVVRAPRSSTDEPAGPPDTTPAAPAPPGAAPPDGAWRTLASPIDPAQLTDVPFGRRSHWLQPWRAYLDTRPAAQLRNAVGVNFNVPAHEADAVAGILADSGFTRARLEIGWSEMDFDDPEALRNPAAVRARLAALKAHGIRPLILLNANHAGPGPLRRFTARITAAAPQGARSVQVDAATAAVLEPGLTGLDGFGKAAEFIVTSVSAGGQVGLSKPLPIAIPAGAYPASGLRFAPFAAPRAWDGTPNHAFERTVVGWLLYVRAVTQEAKALFGDEFDVEVWNELSFGSDFLYADRYYDPVPPSLAGAGDVTSTLLARTVQWLRDPANGLGDIGIGDGFSSQTPFTSGSTSPAGLTALDKHPYHANVKAFPGAAVFSDIWPVDAHGEPDGTIDWFGRFRDSFVPEYRAFFPEYYLSAIQTESLVRDVAPIVTTYGGADHGRSTRPAGTSTPLEVWVTETNIDPAGAGALSDRDKRHLQAKATLRTLASFVNKGISRVYFYAVRDGDFAMLDPWAGGGGETMTAVRRLTAAMAGPATVGRPRAVTLNAIADRHGNRQFDGDGTSAHPPLLHRELVAFLPFQVDSDRFVVPTYVMTRDMARVYRPGAPATDVGRLDLPPETYRLTVGGIRADRLRVSVQDPLTGQQSVARVIERLGDTAVVELDLTDSPRLLTLDDG